jgi:hypothetical protein
VAGAPFAALNELGRIFVREVELALQSVLGCARIVRSTVVCSTTLDFCLAVSSGVSLVALAQISSDFVLTDSVFAWVGSTVVFHAVAHGSCPSIVTFACVAVDSVDTGSVLAWIRVALINVRFAEWTTVSFFAETAELVDEVVTRSVDARI